MKHDKSTRSEAGESTAVPTKPRLVLKRRPVASLSEKQLSEVAGGHPHPPTCEPTCPDTCAYSCGGTCPVTCVHTCQGDRHSCGPSCHMDECPVP